MLLPLSSYAQFGRSYTGPTMQQNMQSRQDFNRMTNQRTMDFQSRQLQKNRSASGTPATAGISAEAQRQAQAKQQQAEQAANDKLAQLAQAQERKRLEHPAKNPQQAAAQQQADDRQLALLALKNYRDVFLPGQFATALQARDLSPKAQQTLQTLNDNLASDGWWSKQPAAQLPATVKACGDSLTALTAGLLGFDLASPPPTPAQLSSSRLDDMLAKGTFTPAAAAQLVQEVATAEKLISGDKLAQAVLDFQRVSSTEAATPKKLRKATEASLNRYNVELMRYQARIYSLSRLPAAQKAMVKATTTYLAKNGG